METSDVPHPPPVDASSSNMAVHDHELDEETARKLRADTIGDTTCSETFVLKTLQHYSDLKWTREVENDLRSLWDMVTNENAVCEFLVKASYPELVTSAICLHTEPTFIEIAVGIFTSLLCSKCVTSIESEEVETVLNVLNSDNPNVLIQVMRFLHALSYGIRTLDFVEEVHLNKIDFILCRSTNKELLYQTLKTLASITRFNKVDESLLSGELLGSALTAYGVLKEKSKLLASLLFGHGTVKANLYHQKNCFSSQELRLNMKHLITCVCNLCTAIDFTEDDRIRTGLIPNLDRFLKEVINLLKYYKIPENLLPVTNDFRFYMNGFTYICKALNVVYETMFVRTLYEIFSTLYKKDLSSIDAVAEVFCYFISVGSFRELKRDFRMFCPIDMKEIFSYIMKRMFEFEFNYDSNVRRFLAEFEC